MWYRNSGGLTQESWKVGGEARDEKLCDVCVLSSEKYTVQTYSVLTCTCILVQSKVEYHVRRGRSVHVEQNNAELLRVLAVVLLQIVSDELLHDVVLLLRFRRVALATNVHCVQSEYM